MTKISSVRFMAQPIIKAHCSQTIRFGADSPPEPGRPGSPSSGKSWKQKLQTPLLILGGILGLGGSTAWVNKPPANCIGTARESILGIPAPWPSAYINESREVINPWLGSVSGHITPDGHATGWVISKGSADDGGYLYKPLSPIASGTINDKGTVYKRLGLVPEGYVDAPTLSRKEKGAFAMAAKLLGSGSSSGPSKK